MLAEQGASAALPSTLSVPPVELLAPVATAQVEAAESEAAEKPGVFREQVVGRQAEHQAPMLPSRRMGLSTADPWVARMRR